ncbi:MAG: 3'(2'),5'-bisphosphate nucleotidase CysQ [Rhodospirillales bacterium]|nr:3'(2'),5'-bisphosphate nucleotidase CysQ [Rhodospirillales bacterium]QQS15206.1 MAG: 3'(2'),5'-bisphosphate nucleotidase CysQ [Rhodospirillales bacterium]
MPALTDLAHEAGAAIMAIYAKVDHGERRKSDASPVTDADHAAEAVILAGLARLTPGIPVVAEEEVAAGRMPDVRGGPFWLVDPLDGTKEFLKRNGEFTVNIALVEDGRVALGVVSQPTIDTTWRGVVGLGAEIVVDRAPPRPIATRRPPAAGYTVFASRSTAIYSQLDIWLRNNGVPVAERKQAGSSLKFCLIAAGEADIYPRFGPTMEWDTAAGQAVLEAAGGEVRDDSTGAPLRYGKPGHKNPWFVARGVPAGRS